MYRKSIMVVLIQFVGIILGLLSLFLIIGDINPEVYSLVGVYTIIFGIVLSFSDLGIETVMMREALYWIKNDDYEKIFEHATQAIVSRLIAFIILSPFLLGYIFYLWHYKYDNKYLLLLITFIIGSMISVINDSFSLIIRSKGGYVYSQFAKVLNTYFAKIGSIFLFFIFGELAYLYFTGLASIPLFFLLFLKIRKNFKFRYLSIKDTFIKIIKSKYLWLKTKLDYFKMNIDGVLVSTLFSPAILGSYTIYKIFENISKSFIEGFFDVLSQETVRNKGNKVKILELKRIFKKITYGFIIIIVVGLVIFVSNSQYFIDLLRLNKYDYMKEMIIVAALISIIHLLGKYEINMLSFFAPTKVFFSVGVSNFIFTVFSYIVIILVPTIYGMLIQRVIVYLLATLYSVIIYTRSQEKMISDVSF